MKVIWSSAAKLSLKEIADYIALDSRKRALDLTEKIYDKSKALKDFPEIGRVGRVYDTREIVVHKNYILVYRIKSNEIQILQVFHSARKWPLEFNG